MDETLLHCIEADDGDVKADFSLDIKNSISGLISKVKYSKTYLFNDFRALSVLDQTCSNVSNYSRKNMKL